jgi:tetratricopeptide (TPR) repeat protein
MPAVTVAALVCGAACVVAARPDEEPRPLRRAVRVGSLAAALLLSAVAFVGLVGNSALSESEDAVHAGRWDIAETQARRAVRWASWSAEGWQRLGEVEVALENPAGARDYFRRAIAKDPDNWLLWYELASVARGEERRRAARRVVRLNPLSAEAAEMRGVAGL